MNTEGTKFKMFDQVRIVTTRNVHYLSAPPGSDISPKGIWQVSGAVDVDLLLVKGNATIKIPATDVLKVVDYDVNAITAKFGRLSENVKARKEDREEEVADSDQRRRTPEVNG